MIFPRKKTSEFDSPWWEVRTSKKSSRGNTLLIALLAGSVGGFLGVNSSGGVFFRNANIVSSTSTIERAPDSVAGIAARVLRQLFQLQLDRVVEVELVQGLSLIAPVIF